jgi:DNA-binding CsgD family transcriptional regulator/GAF domain-containing protein
VGDLERLSGLVAGIYDAGNDPVAWQPVLADIRDWTGGEAAQVLMLEPGAGACRRRASFAATVGYDPAAHAEYVADYALEDPRLPAWRRLPPHAQACHEVVDADWFDRQPLGDFLDRHGYRWTMGAIEPEFAPGLAGIGVHRARREGPFTPEEVRRLDLLVPHIRRMLALHQRLDALTSRAGAAEDVLDRLDRALILLTADGRVLHANLAAEQLFESGRLRLRGNRLESPDAAEASALRALVAAVLDPMPDSVLTRFLPGPGGAGALIAGGCRLPARRPASVTAPLAAAVLFLTPLGAAQGDLHQLLPAMFGLSPAEVRLAVSLHDGLSLTEIADQLRLSRETLRTQLRMMFDKTGTRRQGALIRLLADLAREGRLVRQRHAEVRGPRPNPH